MDVKIKMPNIGARIGTVGWLAKQDLSIVVKDQDSGYVGTVSSAELHIKHRDNPFGYTDIIRVAIKYGVHPWELYDDMMPEFPVTPAFMQTLNDIADQVVNKLNAIDNSDVKLTAEVKYNG